MLYSKGISYVRRLVAIDEDTLVPSRRRTAEDTNALEALQIALGLLRDEFNVWSLGYVMLRTFQGIGVLCARHQYSSVSSHAT